jgi:hypothetical protein
MQPASASGLIASLAAGLLAAGVAAGSPIGLKASLGVDYTSGDYGLSQETRTVEVPIGLEATWRRLRLSVRSGFIANDGPVIAGVPGASRNPRGAGGGGPLAPADDSGQGVSDLRLLGGVLLTMPPEDSPLPWVEVQGQVKVAMADEDDGLGTGEHDYRVGLDVFKTFGPITPFANVGYRFRGDPGGANESALNDGPFASVGASWRVVDRFSVGTALDWAESAADGVDDALELSPFASIGLGERVSLGPYATIGFSDGSPDYGFGAQLTFRLLQEDWSD